MHEAIPKALLSYTDMSIVVLNGHGVTSKNISIAQLPYRKPGNPLGPQVTVVTTHVEVAV